MVTLKAERCGSYAEAVRRIRRKALEMGADWEGVFWEIQESDDPLGCMGKYGLLMDGTYEYREIRRLAHNDALGVLVGIKPPGDSVEVIWGLLLHRDAPYVYGTTSIEFAPQRVGCSFAICASKGNFVHDETLPVLMNWAYGPMWRESGKEVVTKW